MALEAYSPFQRNLLQTLDDAGRVGGFLVDIFRRSQYQYGEDVQKKLKFQFERMQKFLPYARPTLTQEIEIFRLLGARQVYIYKVLENEKLPRVLIQLVMGHLANDVAGFEEFEISHFEEDRVRVPLALMYLGKTRTEARNQCLKLDGEKYQRDFSWEQEDAMPADCEQRVFNREIKAYDQKLKDAVDRARTGFLEPQSAADQLKMSMLLVNLADDKAKESTCKVEEVVELPPDG